jgi:hypothetical protein
MMRRQRAEQPGLGGGQAGGDAGQPATGDRWVYSQQPVERGGRDEQAVDLVGGPGRVQWWHVQAFACYPEHPWR